MVRRRREGAHELSSSSYLGQSDVDARAGCCRRRSSVSKLQWWIGVSGFEAGLTPGVCSAAARPAKVALPIAGPGWNRRARLSERSETERERVVRSRLRRRWSREGEGDVFYTARKRRQARARALPNQAGAKPGGANRSTEIIVYRL